MLSVFNLSLSISVAICAFVLVTKPYHIRHTAKGHFSSAKQSSHKIPTPRIGGLALVSFFVTSIYFLNDGAAGLAFALLVSSLPVFIGGFGEDIGFDITPKVRLNLSFLSAAIAGIVLDIWIVRTGVGFLDSALSYPIVAIAFTMLVSGGICHSMNLVDGLNGLALGLSIIISGTLAIISFLTGDQTLFLLCLILVSTLIGVFCFNFPLGKIFLGDAGAYTIGHLLTWISVLLMARNPEVAPFAVFLIFFWPVADMVFSILRRLRNGKPVDQPDRMHFHQFVMRAIELTFNFRRTVSNPLAASVIWPVASIPAFLAIMFHDSNALAAFLWIICFGVFVWTYIAGIRLAKFLSRARKGNETLLATINREGLTNIRSAVTKQRA